MIINIQDDILVLNSKKLLHLLLKDKTTKKNIMWATDLYQDSGKLYERNEEITLSAITGDHINMIKTRARKEFEQQNERTRIHAEVFTPSWIVSVNFVQADAALASKNGKLEDLVNKHFGSHAVGAVKKN